MVPTKGREVEIIVIEVKTSVGDCPIPFHLVRNGDEQAGWLQECGDPEVHALLLCQLKSEGWICYGLGRFGAWWFARKAGGS